MIADLRAQLSFREVLSGRVGQLEQKGTRRMGTFLLSMVLLVSSAVTLTAADQPPESLHTYVDSFICARLMLGPISESRIGCSISTAKDGANPVLVLLHNNMVLEVNNQKLLNNLAGQLALATGQVKVSDGTMKLVDVKPERATDIPANDPARKLLSEQHPRRENNAKLYEKIRHELAMMPYVTNFDFISFSMSGTDIILTGWTVRDTNRSEAYNRVKRIEGITSLVNNIEILPLGSNDMRIRANARAQLQRTLSRYFWDSGSDIKIVVKYGDIVLLGAVATQSDIDKATLMCKQVNGAFHVFNLLRIRDKEG